MTKLLNLIHLLRRVLLIDPKLKMAIATTLLINFAKTNKHKSILFKCEYIINKSKSILLEHECIIKSKIRKAIATTLQMTFVNNKTKMLRR